MPAGEQFPQRVEKKPWPPVGGRMVVNGNIQDRSSLSAVKQVFSDRLGAKPV